MPQSSQDPDEIDPPVVFEVAVFDGEYCLAQERREVVVADHDAALEGKTAEAASMHVVQLRRCGRPVVLQFVDLRQIDRVDQHQAGEAANGCGEKNEEGEDDTGSDSAAFGGRLKAGIVASVASAECLCF